MAKPVLLYGAVLAAGAFAIEWLDFKHTGREISTGLYVLAVALLFAGLGVWVGNRLTAKSRSAFTRNDAAIASLGLSGRECEVLELLASGCSNKIIARRLAISPNTVKTHIQRVYEKLEVENRTKAAAKARELMILP